MWLLAGLAEDESILMCSKISLSISSKFLKVAATNANTQHAMTLTEKALSIQLQKFEIKLLERGVKEKKKDEEGQYFHLKYKALSISITCNFFSS